MAGLAAGLALAMPAGAAATGWRIAAPTGHISATVRAPAGTPLQATIRRDGRRILRTSIGLVENGRCRPQGFELAGVSRTRQQGRYATPAGKRREHAYAARALALRFRRGRSELTVELRAAADGLAYRTRVSGPVARRVTGECSAFAAPPHARAWLQRFRSNYEGRYEPGALRDAAPGQVGFPALVSSRAGWTLLTESAIPRGQPASRLRVRRSAPGVLSVMRPRTQPGLERLVTPWRVAVIGSLATIVESDLVDDLAPGPDPRGWRWVKPGRVAWSWWADSASPRSLERQQRYVDFAAREGWEYVLVDAGWSPSWLPELARYARERNVGVLLWSRWDALATQAQRDRLLPLWRSWGAAGVKLDFMHSDSHRRMSWYQDVARAAAGQRLLVDFHGSTVPRGLSRTWPNVLTMEGVVGAEAYKGDAAFQPSPAHNATLPFTRNAIGPMDYTPVTFSATTRRTTAAHELALSVVFASGLQHFADSPEAYDAQPLAERWLRSVPVAWDDTRLLDGYPGVAATIARRAAGGWYVGAIRAGAAGDVDLPLDFLRPGREYDAWTIEDSPAGGLVERSRRVTAADVVRLGVAPSGGYVARFTPAA